MREDKLQDPSLLPGAIVATHDDDPTLQPGQVRRNDGVVLNTAARNSWYVLATVAGEHEKNPPGIHDVYLGLHARNRRFWNGWMCQTMSEAERAALAERLNLPPEELAPLTKDERATVERRFAKAFPGEAVKNRLPDPDASVDMIATHFAKQLVFERCVFRREALFYYAHFAGDAWLGNAHFGNGFFSGAHFAGFAFFSSAHFAGFYDFSGTHFAGLADFSATHFGAGFFEGAHFAGTADFRRAHFDGLAEFSNGAFKRQTDFTDAHFKTWVPEFYQCEMHQDTVFPTKPANWPTPTKDNANSGKRAYSRLRQIANEAQNPDDAHFFLRQEMRCKEVLADPCHGWLFRLYRGLSNYGYSVARPAAGLVLAWLVPGFFYYFHFLIGAIHKTAPVGIFGAFGLSFANLLAFFGFNRLYFHDVLPGLPGALQALAGAQTIAGAVLVFLLGPGLRNRFRLR